MVVAADSIALMGFAASGCPVPCATALWISLHKISRLSLCKLTDAIAAALGYSKLAAH